MQINYPKVSRYSPVYKSSTMKISDGKFAQQLPFLLCGDSRPQASFYILS